MNCDRYEQMLSARLDGALTAEEAKELECHLEGCPACRALGAQLAVLQDSLEDMDDLSAPGGFTQGVMARVRAEEKKNAKVVPLLRRPQFKALAGLAACAVLCVGLYQGGLFDGGVEQETADTTYSLKASEMPEAGAEAAPASLDEMDAMESGTWMESAKLDIDRAAFSAEPDFYPFQNEQYIRVCCGSTPAAPSARILGSADSLADFAAQFPGDDLSAVTQAYGADFFETGRLLAIVVEETCGSVRHTIAALEWEQVLVQRQIPEEGTQDMAAWLILAEVDARFEEGHMLSVVWSE